MFCKLLLKVELLTLNSFSSFWITLRCNSGWSPRSVKTQRLSPKALAGQLEHRGTQLKGEWGNAVAKQKSESIPFMMGGNWWWSPATTSRPSSANKNLKGNSACESSSWDASSIIIIWKRVGWGIFLNTLRMAQTVPPTTHCHKITNF